MLTRYMKPWIPICIVVCFLMTPLLIQAQQNEGELPPGDEPTRDPGKWMELLQKNMPPAITEDNSALVKLLMNPRLGPPLSQSFDRAFAISKLIGRGAVLTPDCRKVTTPTGDIDSGDCRAYRGEASGDGPYKELRFSKRMTLGNISFFDREAEAPVDPSQLKPIQMSDKEAYQKAVDFLSTNFGLTMEEVPTPPGDILPVHTIALGYGEKGTIQDSIPVEKIVTLPRGLFVNASQVGGCPEIAKNCLDYVPGPGKAMVVINDSGVKEALVRDWHEVIPHPGADLENPKKGSELVNEMAEDLARMNQRADAKLSFRIVLSSIPSPQGVGLLLPAVQLRVSPVADDPSEEEQATYVMRSTAGMILDYPLVRIKDSLVEDEPNAL